MRKALYISAFLLGSLAAVAQTAQTAFVRRSVIEEYTGTWCGNCPRGIVGMQRLAQDYGDRYIGIAVHTGASEPMVIPTYPDLQKKVIPGSGAPSCTIDRVPVKLDPYSGSGQNGIGHYGIGVDFGNALAQPTEADVQLTAQWADAQQWDVRFTAVTTFNINSADAPYRLVFVLTEDSLVGTTPEWEQVNYFSSAYSASAAPNYPDDDMAQWRDSPYSTPGVVYNHVAVNTLGVLNGIQNSIKAPIVSYEPQTYSNTLTTLNVKVIQNKAHLHAVCMLISTETGQVVNAAKADILPYGSASIAAPAAASEAAAVYDLQGRRLYGTPVRGIYVQDGKKRISNGR